MTDNTHPDAPAGAQNSAAEGTPLVVSAQDFLTGTPQGEGATGRVDAQQPRCAVLGRPIAHSLSPVLHSAGYEALGLDYSYYRVEAGELDELRALVDGATKHNEGGQGIIAGFSVTMPGKHAALDVADEVTDRARKIGAANTLLWTGAGWCADNTDVDGVMRCLERVLPGDDAGAGMVRLDRPGLVVGNGGTARPAIAALAAIGCPEVVVVARSDKALALEPLAAAYGVGFRWVTLDSPDLDAVCAEAGVVISTIPAAAAAGIADYLAAVPAVIDVIYDPYPTPLLTRAEERGAATADGLVMLAGQAEEQFAQFTGAAAPQGVMLAAAYDHLGLSPRD